MNYSESGKINWNKAGLKFLIALVASGLMGIIYGAITAVNPIIYLNFLLLIGVYVAFSFITGLSVITEDNRNPTIRAISIIILILFAWYTNWVMFLTVKGLNFWESFFNVSETLSAMTYYSSTVDLVLSNRGRSGTSVGQVMPIAHIVEFGVFMYIAYTQIKEKVYYCENCEDNMISLTIDNRLIEDINKDNLNENVGKIISERFAEDYDAENDTLDINGFHRFVIKICPKCGKAVVTLQKATMVLDANNKVKNTKETDIYENVLLDGPLLGYEKLLGIA